MMIWWYFVSKDTLGASENNVRYLDPVIITSSKMSIAAAEDVTLKDCLQMSEMEGRWE